MLVKNFQSYQKTDKGYLIEADHAKVQLIFLTDDIIRIRTSFTGEFPEASYALVTTAWEDDLDELLAQERQRIQALDVPAEEYENTLVFRTRTLTLSLQKEPFAFSLQNDKGEVIYQEIDYRSYEKDHLGRLNHYTRVNYQHDHFFGFGEQNGPLDKMGKHMHINPRDAIALNPETGGPTYKHIPFYIRVNDQNRHALGLFYNNSHDCMFDMGNERSGYWDSYCYYQVDGGDIDLFLINGPSPAKVVQGYTYLTGRQTMPKKQSLGFMYTTMYYGEFDRDCDQKIYEVLDEFQAQNMPIHTFGLPSGYSAGDDRKRYSFHWNLNRFPDPAAFVENLAGRGIDIIPNTKPGILAKHPNIKDFETADAFVKTADGKEDYVGRWWGGAGRFVDFTKPEARQVWTCLMKQSMLDIGIHSIWNDNCEYDGVEDREALCCREGLGGTMEDLKAIQSSMMGYTVYHGLLKEFPEERPYILSRCGYAGIQRYAQTWGGDNLTCWEALKYNVGEILNAGISGLSNYGCDIGGFAGPAPDREMLVRWFQNGIFQPRFCMNSASSDNSVSLPWMYEEEAPLVRDALHLRYHLMPYLYSLMWESNQTGIPAVRPLFMEFPDDPACYKDKTLSFMFGPSLLVANVLNQGETLREIYLPAGTVWYDLNQHFTRYEGGQTIFYPVDLESIPMFIRGGAILVTAPAIDPCHPTEFMTVKKLGLTLAPDQDGTFIHYDDDGTSMNFAKGEFAQTAIQMQAGERVIIDFTKTGQYPDQYESLEVGVINKVKAAFWVTLDGERLAHYQTKLGYDQAEEGWYFNMTDRVIYAKFAKPQADHFRLVVSFEEFDLIAMENNG